MASVWSSRIRPATPTVIGFQQVGGLRAFSRAARQVVARLRPALAQQGQDGVAQEIAIEASDRRCPGPRSSQAMRGA
jgi:hypothetical protein